MRTAFSLISRGELIDSDARCAEYQAISLRLARASAGDNILADHFPLDDYSLLIWVAFDDAAFFYGTTVIRRMSSPQKPMTNHAPDVILLPDMQEDNSVLALHPLFTNLFPARMQAVRC